MASRVLRNVQIPEDSTTPSLQALADAKQYINERAGDVWRRRLWPEYLILGSYTIPASTQRIALSSITGDTGFTTSANGYNATFYDVVAIREGASPLTPEDPAAINLLQADLWAATTSPVAFVNRGQSGIFLLGQYPTSKLLNFFGKAAVQDMSDSETWCMKNDQCLVAGATGDMIRDYSKDDNRSQIRYQEFEAEIAKMIDNAEAQMANIKRVIPINPFTKNIGKQVNTAVIGMWNIQ